MVVEVVRGGVVGLQVDTGELEELGGRAEARPSGWVGGVFVHL